MTILKWPLIIICLLTLTACSPEPPSGPLAPGFSRIKIKTWCGDDVSFSAYTTLGAPAVKGDGGGYNGRVYLDVPVPPTFSVAIGPPYNYKVTAHTEVFREVNFNGPGETKTIWYIDQEPKTIIKGTWDFIF